MSSIFSDPFFRRGNTLLGGELIEVDTAGNPIAGNEIVGQVKAFQDVHPASRGERFSNRLVFCVAARYKGSTVSDASTVAGELYLFDTGKPLAEFTSKATATNATAGLAIGVLDEYLTGELRQNDIVWLVVKGPTSIKRTAAAVNAGVAVQASATAGSIATLSTGIAIGQQIVGANTSASAGLTRVNLHSDEI
jgi:hypothetical protein